MTNIHIKPKVSGSKYKVVHPTCNNGKNFDKIKWPMAEKKGKK